MGKSFTAMMEFLQEFKTLSYEDKLWYHKALCSEGYTCDEPAKPENQNA